MNEQQPATIQHLVSAAGGASLCLDKSAFHRWREGTDLIRLSEGAQKVFLCTDQSALALCSEQWWLSHKWSVPAFSLLHLGQSLLKPASREHGTHGALRAHQAAPLSLTCDRSFLRLCWPPCALQNASENLTPNLTQGLCRSIHSQVKLCSCSRLL